MGGILFKLLPLFIGFRPSQSRQRVSGSPMLGLQDVFLQSEHFTKILMLPLWYTKPNTRSPSSCYLGAQVPLPSYLNPSPHFSSLPGIAFRRTVYFALRGEAFLILSSGDHFLLAGVALNRLTHQESVSVKSSVIPYPAGCPGMAHTDPGLTSSRVKPSYPLETKLPFRHLLQTLLKCLVPSLKTTWWISNFSQSG